MYMYYYLVSNYEFDQTRKNLIFIYSFVYIT